jgi:hypothetical protein
VIVWSGSVRVDQREHLCSVEAWPAIDVDRVEQASLDQAVDASSRHRENTSNLYELEQLRRVCGHAWRVADVRR